MGIVSQKKEIKVFILTAFDQSNSDQYLRAGTDVTGKTTTLWTKNTLLVIFQNLIVVLSILREFYVGTNEVKVWVTRTIIRNVYFFSFFFELHIWQDAARGRRPAHKTFDRNSKTRPC